MTRSAEAEEGSTTEASPRELHELREENRRLRAELEQLRQLRELAYCDPLTGLWNRRYLDERLPAEIDRAERHPAQGLSLLVVDLDGLKRINDRDGHAAGDEAIRRAAALLRSSIREHDVCVRTGGDEFAVILPGAGAEGSALMTRRLRRALTEAADGGTGSDAPSDPALGFSLGAASWPDDGAEAEALLAAADRAMYRDKELRKLSGSVADRAPQRGRTAPWPGPVPSEVGPSEVGPSEVGPSEVGADEAPGDLSTPSAEA